MPYNNNPNAGWLFYRGYYTGELNWTAVINALESKSTKDKESQQKHFKVIHDDFKAINLVPKNDEVKHDTFPLLYTNYPGLLIGTGHTHELGMVGEIKIGFYFDYTTGMPNIPGSSVKGAIRALFPQFKSKSNTLWEILPSELNDKEKTRKSVLIAALIGLIDSDKAIEYFEDEALHRQIHHLELALFSGLDIVSTLENKEEAYHSIYKRDIFHDAFPTKGGDSKLFDFDFITPHTGGAKTIEEYQKKVLKNPVPIQLLKVKPNIAYQFHFDCHLPDLGLSLGDKRLTIDKQLRLGIYEAIICEFGVGAKTNVGYGQFYNPNEKSQASESTTTQMVYYRGNLEGLNNGTLTRGKVSQKDNEIRMTLPDITGYNNTHTILRNKGINYQIGDLYEIKVFINRGTIQRIEHSTNITPLPNE